MTDPNLTSITVILDRSGSMQPIDTDTCGGFNAFIEEQKKLSGDATLTLIRFDDTYVADYVDKPIKDVPKLLTVEPRGMTAMNDAIGKGINELGEKFAKLPEEKRPGRVVFVIITDGQENASKEFTKAQIKKMVEHQNQKYGWAFTYLGANQDAVLAGGDLGISSGSSVTFTGNNVRTAFCAMSASVGNYRATAELTSYSAAMRAQLVEPGDTQQP